MLDFLAEMGAAGWDFDYLPDLDVSLALPLGRLMAPETEAGGERRWSADGTLTVLTHGFATAAQALDWHRAAETAGATGALTVQRSPDRYVTAGLLKDGRRFYTRSDRRGGRWATIYLAGDESESGVLNLVASSIRPGPPDPWDVSGRGRLGEILSETATFLEASDAITVPAPEVTSLPRADTGFPAPAPDSTSAPTPSSPPSTWLPDAAG